MGYSYPLITVAGAADDKTIVKATTANGAMNTSYYGFGDDSNKFMAGWMKPVAKCGIGYFSGKATFFVGENPDKTLKKF